MIKQCKVMIKLLTGEGNLRINTGRWDAKQKLSRNDRKCIACNEAVETLEHMLLECTALDGQGRNLLTLLEKHGLDQLNNRQRIELIFNVGNRLQDHEMIEIANTVYTMYNDRPITQIQ